jgi:hypothetical protein
MDTNHRGAHRLGSYAGGREVYHGGVNLRVSTIQGRLESAFQVLQRSVISSVRFPRAVATSM